MYNFNLTDAEIKKYVEWITEVRKRNPEKRTAIGGAETFCFTPTSIGTIVKVKYFDEEIDITDYSEW